MLRPGSRSTLALVAALAFGAGWWAASSFTAGEHVGDPRSASEGFAGGATEPQAEGPVPAPAAIDESRIALDPQASDPVVPAEPEDEVGTEPRFDDAFLRELEGPERAAFLAEHRWEYIRTNRDSILRNLEQLEGLADPRERYSKANSLLQSSIALILDVQNRAVAWEPGVPVSHPMGRGGWYSFLSSNWIYRVHVDEFPEIAYFHAGAPREVDPETGEVRFLSIDPQQLAQVHQRASQALELYENSAPPGGD